MHRTTVFAGALALACAGALTFAASPSGPPQFITLPILTHVAGPGLDHGHFVFGGEAAIPAPLAHDLGAATYRPASPGGPPITAAGDQNVSASPDSYEGETSAAGASQLVGASNHIYPGACDASAPQNGVGDCAVMAYTSSDGATFSKTTIPRTWNGTTFGITFDPGLDYDQDGHLYFSFGGAPLGGSYPNSVAVSK